MVVLVFAEIGLIFFIEAAMRLVFWICAGNSIDSTAMFSLFLSSIHTASRSFLPHTSPHQAEVHENLGGATGRTPDFN